MTNCIFLIGFLGGMVHGMDGVMRRHGVWAWTWGGEGGVIRISDEHSREQQSRNDLIWGPGKNGDECTMTYFSFPHFFLIFLFK